MPGKFKIVVSDLHMGAGHRRQGNLLEDFDRDQDFAALLAEIAAESARSGSAVELIVNGDAFEMLQVPHVAQFVPAETYPSEFYRSFTESASLAKMRHIVAGHSPFFDALRRFIHVAEPTRSITFVKGNHDLDLFWPSVKQCIRQAVGALGDAAPLLAFEELAVHREGIHIEHGNQYEGALSRVADMIRPLRGGTPPEIDIPPGSRFVIDALNPVEWDRYWIDGIKPIAALVWYTLAYDFPFAFSALVKLMLSSPALLADLIATPGSLGRELLRSREYPLHIERLSARYAADAAYRSRLHAQVAEALAPLSEGHAVRPSSFHDASNAALYAQDVQRATHQAQRDAAARIAEETGSRVVVFGHTHEALQERSADGAMTFINSGTWTWHADFGAAGKETWRELFVHPERFTADRRLTYARIDYDADGQPAARLLEFQPARYASLHERLNSWFLPDS